MAFLVTIIEEDNEEKPLLIADAAEITPLFDIEPDEAAFALGLEPSSALIYYLAFDWSPFNTNLGLLDAPGSITYMVSCLEHIWPIIEEYFESTVSVEAALGMGRAIVAQPHNVPDEFELARPHRIFSKRSRRSTSPTKLGLADGGS